MADGAHHGDNFAAATGSLLRATGLSLASAKKGYKRLNKELMDKEPVMVRTARTVGQCPAHLSTVEIALDTVLDSASAVPKINKSVDRVTKRLEAYLDKQDIKQPPQQ